jgi:hypothetical protein
MMQTVSDLLAEAAETIGDASDTPGLDARILLQALLKKDHAWLLAHGDEPVDGETAARLRAWVKRRAKERAGRLHHRKKGILEPRPQDHPRRAGPAPGNRDPGRTRNGAEFRCPNPSRSPTSAPAAAPSPSPSPKNVPCAM